MTLREYLDRHLNHDTYCASWLYGSAFGQILHNDHETRCNCSRREILSRWDNMDIELTAQRDLANRADHARIMAEHRVLELEKQIDNSNNKEYKESSNNT